MEQAGRGSPEGVFVRREGVRGDAPREWAKEAREGPEQHGPPEPPGVVFREADEGDEQHFEAEGGQEEVSPGPEEEVVIIINSKLDNEEAAESDRPGVSEAGGELHREVPNAGERQQSRVHHRGQD